MRLIYTGDGFLPGVPARDLEEHEVEAHGGAKKLISSGLHTEEKDKPAAGKRADKDGK